MPRTPHTSPDNTEDQADNRLLPSPERTGSEAPVTGLPAILLTADQLRSTVESLLFVAGRPLQLGELRRLLAVDDKRLRPALDALADECERSGRGVRLQRLDDQVQLVSAPENARYVAALLGMPAQAKLTTAALETLAVVAYRQPITRSQIEFIRGVNSDRALSSLMQYGLVVEVGRASTVGRPALFGTTPEFLGQFGLTSIEALPKPEMLELDAAEAGRVAAANRIREAVGAGDEPAPAQLLLELEKAQEKS
jgi:segregation and condensation protein B